MEWSGPVRRVVVVVVVWLITYATGKNKARLCLKQKRAKGRYLPLSMKGTTFMSTAKIAENNSSCNLPASSKPFAVVRGVRVHLVANRQLGYCVILEKGFRVVLWLSDPSRFAATRAAQSYITHRNGSQLTLWADEVAA